VRKGKILWRVVIGGKGLRNSKTHSQSILIIAQSHKEVDNPRNCLLRDSTIKEIKE
jgi:hypothetical protein